MQKNEEKKKIMKVNKKNSGYIFTKIKNKPLYSNPLTLPIF